MKKLLLPLLLLLLSTLLCPAYCQTQRQNSLVSKLPPGRAIRVTTGSVEVKGWEHGLIERSPNLARWHWDPLYSTTQAYISAPRQSARPGSHYAKPIHVTTTRANTPPSGQSRYVKPIHAPFNLPAKDNMKENVLARRLDNPNKENLSHNESTYAGLKTHSDNNDKNVSGQLLNKESEHVATYGESYDKPFGVVEKHSRATVSGQVQQAKGKKRK